jgi:uncharacterized RDD family membrane protein YckC
VTYAPDPNAPTQVPEPAPKPQYAGWFRRATGFLIDCLTVVAIITVGAWLATAIGPKSTGANLVSIAFAVLALGFHLYNRWWLGGRGQTIGRMAVRIWLVGDQSGEPIGFWRAVLRDLAHALDSLTCYLGWLNPLWNPRKQTLADILASTLVVSSYS